MKKTILTLASAAALAGTANAQTAYADFGALQDGIAANGDGSYSGIGSVDGVAFTWSFVAPSASRLGIDSLNIRSTGYTGGASGPFTESAVDYFDIAYTEDNLWHEVVFTFASDVNDVNFILSDVQSGINETFRPLANGAYVPSDWSNEGSIAPIGITLGGNGWAEHSGSGNTYSLLFQNNGTSSLDLSLAATAVPEPSSTALLGLGGLTLLLRRKK